MKKIILLFLIAMTTTSGFSQCACCSGAGIGSSNGDYNNGILTLPKKLWIAETYTDYRSIQNGNAPENDEKLLKSMVISSVGVRYGISKKITVSALLPYVFLHTGAGNDKGLGDLILLGTLSVYSKNNLNLALQGGIELPTGVRKGSNFDNTTITVGSGSYDPMLGVSFSKKWNKLMLQGSGLYKQTTKGFQGNYYGSLAIQNLSLSYRIKGENTLCSTDTIASVKTKSKLGLSIFGGYYGEWLGKITEDNIVDQNSGYYIGFLTMGTNISIKKWAFPLTFSLPIVTQMNGLQNDAGFRMRLGIIKSF